MMSDNRSRVAYTLFAVNSALALAGHPVAGNAQDYPVRPVRLVVPFPPGGSNDIVGRVVGVALSDRLGKQVIIMKPTIGGASRRRAARRPGSSAG